MPADLRPAFEVGREFGLAESWCASLTPVESNERAPQRTADLLVYLRRSPTAPGFGAGQMRGVAIWLAIE